MADIIIIQTGADFQSALQRICALKSTVFRIQTEQHPFMARFRDAIDGLISMDGLYESSDDFDALNESIARELILAAQNPDVEHIAYITLGRINPDVLRAVHASGTAVSVTPFAGFGECAYSAAISNELITPDEIITELPANRLERIADTEELHAITEIDSPLTASEVKLVLGEYYPDEYDVVFAVPYEDGSGYDTRRIRLFELDRLKKYDAAAVLLVPPMKDIELPRHSVEGLMQVMHRLRAPGGCPWDAEQTHESLKKSLLEECYEVIDAIDRNDSDDMCEELGDLLLQIAFHVVIEEEHAAFSLRDVATGIVNKMIYRHPHVFGSTHVENSDEVLANWEVLKKREKHQSTVASAMDSVPKSFPSLLRAYKIQKKAADVGFDWDSAEQALPKVHEEADEVLEAIKEGDGAHIADEIGDLFFAAVNVARLKKVDPDLALTAATDKFEKRFKLTEQLIKADGKHFEDMTLPEMDEYWEKAKALFKVE